MTYERDMKSIQDPANGLMSIVLGSLWRFTPEKVDLGQSYQWVDQYVL